MCLRKNKDVVIDPDEAAKRIQERVRNNLQTLLENAAEEIRQNGLESLWHPEQHIISAKITIDIDSDMTSTLKYEKEVYPNPRRIQED